MSGKRPRHDDEQARSDGNNPLVRKQKKGRIRESVAVDAKEGCKNEELLRELFQVKKEVKKVKKQVKELKKEFGRFPRKYHPSKKRLHVKQMCKSASRTLQLKFRNNISLPMFTLTEIEGKDPSALTIALVDAMTEQVVNSGPESSMEVEIVILEGNFKGDEDNNWTFEHFSNNIVREGKDNQTLLTGDVFLTLNEGIGVASKLKITDNSSRTKKRKFRLAARVPDGYFNGMRVKEAITEPFAVKERRGKSYMKKHPPSLDDEVWRLEKIGKELSKRLSSENVNTVKDFLLMLHADTPRLLKILGLTMNDKRWEVIKNHAEECDPINDHPDIQKVEMQQMIKVAYEHWREVDPYADGPILGSSPNVALDSFPDVSTRPENPTDIFRSSQLPNLTTSPSDFPHSGNMEFDFDYFWYEPELQADHGNTSSSFSKVSTQSVAVTWTTLITVMKFSKRIAALKDRSDARS